MNQSINNTYLASFKFEGKSVENGHMDARKSAEALLGIDEGIRFFLSQKFTGISDIDFEIPVRIQKGSWEVLIPQSMGDWITVLGIVGASRYFGTALKEMAKNDVGDKGFKDILKASIKGYKWCIEISKHQKTTFKKKFQEAKFKTIYGINFVGIINELDEVLYVPKVYLEMFTKLPPQLFSKIAIIVNDGRIFKLDFLESERGDKDDFHGYASITSKEKPLFIKSSAEDDILFPELKHDMPVELNGHVTRGNKNQNTIGFEYKNHVLSCYPSSGNISKDKNLLFTDCIITGVVDRLDNKERFIEKRLRIRYSNLTPIEPNTKNLFN